MDGDTTDKPNYNNHNKTPTNICKTCIYIYMHERPDQSASSA